MSANSPYTYIQQISALSFAKYVVIIPFTFLYGLLYNFNVTFNVTFCAVMYRKIFFTTRKEVSK